MRCFGGWGGSSHPPGLPAQPWDGGIFVQFMAPMTAHPSNGKAPRPTVSRGRVLCHPNCLAAARVGGLLPLSLTAPNPVRRHVLRLLERPVVLLLCPHLCRPHGPPTLPRHWPPRPAAQKAPNSPTESGVGLLRTGPVFVLRASYFYCVGDIPSLLSKRLDFGN